MPKGHGKLIDADKLKESLNDKGQEYYYDTETLEPCGKSYDESEIMEAIDNAPTVERQGEWKHNNFDEHYCNKCGHYALWSEEADDYYEVQSNFCPNCGADMRKEADNE